MWLKKSDIKLHCTKVWKCMCTRLHICHVQSLYQGKSTQYMTRRHLFPPLFILTWQHNRKCFSRQISFPALFWLRWPSLRFLARGRVSLTIAVRVQGRGRARGRRESVQSWDGGWAEVTPVSRVPRELSCANPAKSHVLKWPGHSGHVVHQFFFFTRILNWCTEHSDLQALVLWSSYQHILPAVCLHVQLWRHVFNVFWDS